MTAAASSSNKLAPLVVAMSLLLALLLGPPAAAAGLAEDKCFVGWDFPGLRGLAVGLVCSPLLAGPRPPPPTGQGLSEGHYNQKNSYCPRAEQIVKDAVVEATKTTPDIGAGLIRLHFHDAFVRGCDASVLLNQTASGNTDTERTAPPNKDSLRGFEVIDAAKEALEAACPGIVSCADILAFAARDASCILSNGNINYTVPAGRYDGRESFASETNQLPGPGSDVHQLEDSFADQGLSREDMVTLSGAHTVGVARCMFFNFDARLSAMDPGYAKDLRAACSAGGDSTRVNQDRVTPDRLDNQYYKNIDKFVLFQSDAALSSSETIDQVNANAAGNGKWEKDFAYAMVKMGKIGVLTTPGEDEIRKVCWKVNDKKN